MTSNYLESAIKQFEYYKSLGDKTFAQISEDKLFWKHSDDSNSIAVIVKHLAGNMLSRWTDFLTTDGEKDWRNRDGEFRDDLKTKQEVIELWNQGWELLLDTLKTLQHEDLQKIIYIRSEGHTVLEAINRQLVHYPYHVGQIVFIGKMVAEKWESLSIAKGASLLYNAKMSQQQKTSKSNL